MLTGVLLKSLIAPHLFAESPLPECLEQPDY